MGSDQKQSDRPLTYSTRQIAILSFKKNNHSPQCSEVVGMGWARCDAILQPVLTVAPAAPPTHAPHGSQTYNVFSNDCKELPWVQYVTSVAHIASARCANYHSDAVFVQTPSCTPPCPSARATHAPAARSGNPHEECERQPACLYSCKLHRGVRCQTIHLWLAALCLLVVPARSAQAVHKPAAPQVCLYCVHHQHHSVAERACRL